MRTQLLISALLAGTALSIPIDLAAPQSSGNELRDGECKDITFIFARGSTEQGYLGDPVGTGLCSALKAAKPNQVACQGVAPAYTADLFSNLLPKGTSTAAIDEATQLFNLALTKCPNTKIVAGGYSQGAAVMHAAIPGLSSTLKNKIRGVVLFGDTRFKQDGGRIPNFSTDKTKIYCADGDLVCDGTLLITPAHLGYDDDVPDASGYLVSKV